MLLKKIFAVIGYFFSIFRRWSMEPEVLVEEVVEGVADSVGVLDSRQQYSPTTTTLAPEDMATRRNVTAPGFASVCSVEDNLLKSEYLGCGCG